MQEVKLASETIKQNKEPGKSVTLYLNNQLFTLSGCWQWELHADAVYCSDVMMGWPTDFFGTKAVIHPDDKAEVWEILINSGADAELNLQFRIITTYGEVKELSGTRLFIEPTGDKNPLEQSVKEQEVQSENSREAAKLALQKAAYSNAEHLTRSAVWYHNVATSETWYADGIFKTYDLPPQSLNAHLNTFHPFLHPDDRAEVIEAQENAFIGRQPLHLEFRIVQPGGDEKWVYQATAWSFSEKGEQLLTGVLQNISDQKEMDQKCDQDKAAISFQKQLLHFAESATGIGYWQVNVLTKKITYSDNYYRLFGHKPQTIPANFNTFVNTLHPEDLSIYEQVQAKIRKEHTAPEVDYRIIRPDGKIRYIRQRGKSIISGNEILVVGTVQDITVQKALEQKVSNLQETSGIKLFTAQQAEALAGVGNWVGNIPTGEAEWSESFYELLGQKVSAGSTQKLLLRSIHPEDQKRFSNELSMTLTERKETAFSFRLLRRGEVRYLKATFKIMPYNGADLFIGTLYDNTAEQTVSQSLNSQVQLQNLLIDTSPDQTFITDAENKIVLWNKKCEEVYKLKREKVIGENLFDVLPNLKQEPLLERLNKVLAGQEIRTKHQKGFYILRGYYNMIHTPLQDSAGNITGVLHLLQDVTEQHELTEQLNNRVLFIEKLLEATVDRIVVLDKNMNYLYWNKKAEQDYGFLKEQIIGKNILEVFPQDEVQLSYSDFRKALRGETVYQPATEAAPEEAYLIPVKGEGTEVTAVLWVQYDRKKDFVIQQQAQKALAIINAINENYLELDRDYKVIFINKKALEYFEKEEKDIKGQVIWDVFPQTIDTALHLAFAHVMEERVPVRSEFRSPLKNMPLLVSAVPTVDGMAVAFSDIGFIKNAEQVLAEEHRRLKEAQAIGKIGSFEWDAVTGISLWSDELYRINGLPPQSSPITKEIADSFIYPDDAPALFELKKTSLQKTGSYQLAHRIKNKTGEVRWVAHQWESHANNEGSIVRVTGIVQDITETKLAAQQLQQTAEKLQTILENGQAMIGYCKAVRNINGKIKDIEIEWINSPGAAKAPALKEAHLGLKQRFESIEKHESWQHMLAVIESGAPQRFESYFPYQGFAGWFDVSFTKLGDGFIIQALDIGERKKAASEIQKNLTILQQTEELAQIGSWEYSLESGEFNWSEGMYRLFSLPQEQEVAPEIYTAFSVPADMPIAARITNNIRTGFSSFEETLQINRNGAPRTLKIKGAVVNNEAGLPQKVVGVDLDITDLNEAEKKLADSQLFLQNISETSPDLITVFDLEKKETVYINKTDGDVFGFTPDAFLKMGYKERLSNLIVSEDRQILESFNEMLLDAADNETHTVQYRVRCNNGEIKWYRNRSKIFKRNGAGSPVQVLSVLQDVSTEVDLYQQVTDRSRFISTLFESSIDCMFVLDKNNIVQAWNSQCEVCFNRMRSDVVGKSFTELFPKLAERTNVIEGFKSAFAGVRIQLPPQQEFYSNTIAEIFLIPLLNNVETTEAVLCVMHDVTTAFLSAEELKEANKSLVQKNKELLRTTSDVSAFAYVASHDLKEPLRKIHVFSDLLLTRESADLSESGKAYVLKMSTAVRRLELLIDDILVLTKVHADQQLNDTVDLRKVLSQVLLELRPRFKKTVAKVHAGTLPSIPGNYNQLLQLFKNIILNAFLFQPEGNQPEVTITTATISGSELSIEDAVPDRDYLQLSFADNGIGFDAKYKNRLFIMFERLHAHLNQQGTGMGLAVCKKIMENHNGFITGEPGKESGAVFTCYFPL